MHQFDGQSPDIGSKNPLSKTFKMTHPSRSYIAIQKCIILTAFVLACFWDNQIRILRLTLL